jgi:amidase
VVDKLSEAGHTVLPWEPYKHPYAVDLANRIYASDGGVVSRPVDSHKFPAVPINT